MNHFLFRLSLVILLGSAPAPVSADSFLSGYGSEEALLAESPAATRTAGRLVIETAEKSVRFEDAQEAGEQSVQHRLVARFVVSERRTDYVVSHRSWEGHGYSIVNGTSGETIRLSGPPELSPDGRRYLAASMDLEVGYHPNRLQVVRVEDLEEELRLEAFFQPEGDRGRPSGPSNAVWISEMEILFVQSSLDRAPDGKTSPSRRFMLLERIGDEWQPPRELR